MIVSDSGANMIKAIRLLNERAVDNDAPSDDIMEAENQNDSDSESDSEAGNNIGNSLSGEVDATDEVEMIDLELLNKSVSVPYPRMACLAHSIQLVIKTAYIHYDSLLSKVRHLVGKIRKSSVAVEKIKDRCGKVLVSDNSTRWNSTYSMIARFTELKACVTEVLQDMKTDTLLISEWMRLKELGDLLKPFAEQTDKLQTDCQSLSHIIPALIELQFHLQTSDAARAVTKAMLSDMNARFSCILDPSCDTFNPIPGAACLLNPLLAVTMMTPDMKPLLDATKSYILNEV
jgi:hypothetical protein